MDPRTYNPDIRLVDHYELVYTIAWPYTSNVVAMLEDREWAESLAAQLQGVELQEPTGPGTYLVKFVPSAMRVRAR